MSSTVELIFDINIAKNYLIIIIIPYSGIMLYNALGLYIIL